MVLSVAVACDEGSYVVALNGNSYTWSRTNESDCMVRSGLSGYTQWFVMQWPTSDLTQTAGGDNVISIGMSQPDGASDDALRLELTNTSAAPGNNGMERLHIPERDDDAEQRRRSKPVARIGFDAAPMPGRNAPARPSARPGVIQ